MFKNKITLILAILFSLPLFAQNLSDITFGNDETFEVVTWNIEWFPKNGTTTINSVSQIIEALNVDVIGIQEVDDEVIFKEMIDNLPDYDYHIADEWSGGLAYVYNTNTIEIQSIYKIYDTSPFWKPFPRSPSVMELTFNGEEIIVINNHFKCCGDGILNENNVNDEENRRNEASSLLKEYIDNNFDSKRVIVIGDLNDILTDAPANNVFQMFIEDTSNYKFADMDIAMEDASVWSYPNWPSHLDHILITNEIFEEFEHPNSEIRTIRIDDYLSGGFSEYDSKISDHRPVGLKLQIEESGLSVPEFSERNIKVFPNPSHGNITIDLREVSEDATLKIIDLTGKHIKTVNCKKNQYNEFNLNLEKGIYILSLETETFKTTSKLIIK
ncbi:endonuclease/exonuclease/phosphatase family protein [Aureivirga sp. CE67]|uniref:endonuclease/exonuclease/phosphatase family protein n=1 Tax=Aureivirga sp. CE67 TaxID=1788983 RepID=UPI0018CA6223|nr:endonuclease/exonuclease/phosphatase family protein [Aureivirga sp. CE67]